MKPSLRDKREARKRIRAKQQTKLNLTSLMDIFTILVFFLMVNSSDVQVLENTKAITMPKSVADQKPKETLVLQVSHESVVIGGRIIIDTDYVAKSKEDMIQPVLRELNYQASKRPELTEGEKQVGRAITIQGDHAIPYDILKKLMASAAKAGFRDIALAVSKQAGKKSNNVAKGA